MARILIVDDSSVMRRNLSVILKEAGHTIVGEAVNGKQAVTLYEKTTPDIVTMDISMPVMSGVEALKEILSMDASAKIIMVSALNQKKLIFAALSGGAKHYIIKPIEPDKVVAVINEVLGQAELSCDENDGGENTKSTSSDRSKMGFEVENREGIFLFNFNESFAKKDISALTMALKGMLFVKPLRIVFNFGTVEDMPFEILNSLLREGRKVEDAGGKFDLSAENEIMRKKLGI